MQDLINELLMDWLAPGLDLFEALGNGLLNVLLSCVDALGSFVEGIQELPLLLTNFATAIDPAGVGLLSVVIVGFALLVLRIVLSIF